MALLDLCWRTEFFFSDSGSFFESLIDEVKRAQKTIDLSFYIFANDRVGKALVAELIAAGERGVEIRVLVDGIGTGLWSFELYKALDVKNISFSVYNPVPWPFSRWILTEMFHPGRFLNLLWRINRRNHKKLVVIDNQVAFVGGINISEEEFEWEDFAVQVTGPEVAQLSEVFVRDWEHSFSGKMQRRSEKYKARREKKNRLLAHILSSRRVWITTGYFNPPLRVANLLKKKARRGDDVRIVISQRSDITVLVWLGRLYFKSFLRAGVQIFIYPSRFIHAKCMLLDHEAVVGSSNLNHRSYNIDRELDITLHKKESCEKVHQTFEQLICRSEQVTQIKSQGIIRGFVGRILSLIKSWL